MRASRCDFCGEFIKGKTQFIIDISKCENGTSGDSSGPYKHVNLLFEDLCSNCKNKILSMKKVKK